MTLENASLNKALTVRAIHKGRGARQKLLEMGIFPGVRLKIIARHPFQGPLVVKVSETEVAIGRHLASSIEVEDEREGE